MVATMATNAYAVATSLGTLLSRGHWNPFFLSRRGNLSISIDRSIDRSFWSSKHKWLYRVLISPVTGTLKPFQIFRNIMMDSSMAGREPENELPMEEKTRTEDCVGQRSKTMRRKTELVTLGCPISTLFIPWIGVLSVIPAITVLCFWFMGWTRWCSVPFSITGPPAIVAAKIQRRDGKAFGSMSSRYQLGLSAIQRVSHWMGLRTVETMACRPSLAYLFYTFRYPIVPLGRRTTMTTRTAKQPRVVRLLPNQEHPVCPERKCGFPANRFADMPRPTSPRYKTP